MCESATEVCAACEVSGLWMGRLRALEVGQYCRLERGTPGKDL